MKHWRLRVEGRLRGFRVLGFRVLGFRVLGFRGCGVEGLARLGFTAIRVYGVFVGEQFGRFRFCGNA